MLSRILAIALNTYRENVRARLLHGLFGLAVATAGYALVVGAYAFRDTTRVISDVGAASVSVYGIVVAILLGATSLHRELEHKTVFPILARPIRRVEYLVGKFLGSWLLLLVFVAGQSAVLLLAVSALTGRSLVALAATALSVLGGAGIVGYRFTSSRTFLPIPTALALLGVAMVLAQGAPEDRRVLVGCAVLTLIEVGVVVAIATLFSSFSSPVLTAVFTLGLVIVGRSADSLARLPERVFGRAIVEIGATVARVVPNLMVYVPPRPVLTGESGQGPVGWYLVLAGAQGLGWCLVLLVVASLIFRRRDFL